MYCIPPQLRDPRIFLDILLCSESCIAVEVANVILSTEILHINYQDRSPQAQLG